MIRIMRFEETSKEEIFARTMPTMKVEGAVAEILKNVRERGDEALREYTEKFDHAALDSLIVSPEELAEAKAQV